MPQLTISEVARQVGVRSSAIRYYERLGILPPPARAGGQRRYDGTVLARLAVIQRARQAGFTLHEIRVLFFGFRGGMPAGDRWRALAERKLGELQAMADQITAMQALLRRLQQRCHCETLEDCGKAMLERGLSTVPSPQLTLPPPRRRPAP